LLRLSIALYQAGNFTGAIATAREAADHYGARAATAEAITILNAELDNGTAAGDPVTDTVLAYLCREYGSLAGQNT
jgi:hypothetical protein